ncbi:MAG TPA: hypothetical protein VFQ27_14385 [Xanthobacteraceae bacterium]|nr:hypothetical protein [Xanthobacteraceae bacterium]
MRQPNDLTSASDEAAGETGKVHRLAPRTRVPAVGGAPRVPPAAPSAPAGPEDDDPGPAAA